jgi:hypothetical protein
MTRSPSVSFARTETAPMSELVGRDPKLSFTDVVGAGKRGVISGG